MKKALFLFSLAASVFFMAPATAQEKKLFTPEDASYNNRAIYAQRPNQLQWIGGTDILMKVKGNEIVTMNPDKKKETSFLTLDQMNAYANEGGADSLRRIPRPQAKNHQENDDGADSRRKPPCQRKDPSRGLYHRQQPFCGGWRQANPNHRQS